nr:unnamed protein product [Haemonchus contortus]
MLNLVSLKRGRSTGPLWLVTGTNGEVTGARSRESMFNGTTDLVEVQNYLGSMTQFERPSEYGSFHSADRID